MTEQERPEKRYSDFEFSLRELAGLMGDFGTLFPLALGYITIIAPASLICDYFARREVSERKLLFNMGIMNAVGCLFGGIPVCHGAGGLAGQYYFSARTGGAAILEGLLEVGAGLFLSAGIAGIPAAFPLPLIAGMLFMVGIELGKPALGLKGWKFILAEGTAALSVITNMGIGFATGLAAAHLLKALRKNGS